MDSPVSLTDTVPLLLLSLLQAGTDEQKERDRFEFVLVGTLTHIPSSIYRPAQVCPLVGVKCVVIKLQV